MREKARIVPPADTHSENASRVYCTVHNCTQPQQLLSKFSTVFGVRHTHRVYQATYETELAFTRQSTPTLQPRGRLVPWHLQLIDVAAAELRWALPSPFTEYAIADSFASKLGASRAAFRTSDGRSSHEHIPAQLSSAH